MRSGNIFRRRNGNRLFNMSGRDLFRNRRIKLHDLPDRIHL